MPLQPSPERLLVDVVGEDALAVDLDDGDPLAVARLELGVAVDRDLLELEAELLVQSAHLPHGPLAEVTIRGGVDDDFRDRDPG